MLRLSCDSAVPKAFGRTQGPPDKNRDAQPSELRINLSIYSLDFFLFTSNSLFLAIFRLSNSSEYFNTQGIPVVVNFEWPILCSYNLLSKTVQAPT
jgi:hypothetical protein